MSVDPPTLPLVTSGRMLPSERLDIEVEVYIDTTWWPGTLEHRRRGRDGGWEGYVRWSTGPGETRVGWFPYASLQPQL
jgi:hypothetical protein